MNITAVNTINKKTGGIFLDNTLEASIFTERFNRIIRADSNADASFEGVPNLLPLLEYDIKIPVFNDKDKKFARINEFYKNLASECIKYAEGELTKKSAADYVSSTDPKKRYRYKKFLYSFGYSINFNEIKFAEIKISIRVSSGNEVKFSREYIHRWNLEYLLIMPPEKMKKKKAVKQRHHIQQ